MDAELFGHISRPVIAIVGTWEPLLPHHKHLFTHLRQYADRVSLQPLVIMLDPAPASLISVNRTNWPVYDAPDVRRALITDCGIDAVLTVRFVRQDLDARVGEFFRLVGEWAKVDELLLGANQLFGRGRDSTPEMLTHIARRRKFQLLRLPSDDSSHVSKQVRMYVGDGELRKAVRLVGRAPVWGRPARGLLRLKWPSGIYDCAPLNHPLETPGRKRLRLEMALQKNGFSNMPWPDKSIRWLAFTSGPADS